MPATFKRIEITEEFLNNNPDAYFVFGEDLQKQEKHRPEKPIRHPHAVGFCVRRIVEDINGCCFKPTEYASSFFNQLKQLGELIKNNSNKIFYVSKLGSGSSNKHRIWELLIKHNLISDLKNYDNVVFCWDETEDDWK